MTEGERIDRKRANAVYKRLYEIRSEEVMQAHPNGNLKALMKKHIAQLKEEASTQVIRWKCKTDLFFLCSEIFDMKNAVDQLNGRKRLDPKIHKQMCKEFESNESSLHLWPRDHMKSSIMKKRIVQLLLINPNLRIGMWTSTLKLVKKQLASIMRDFQNDRLLKYFPEYNIPMNQWAKKTAEAFTIFRPDPHNAPQEEMVEAFSVTSGATGHHYDIHFYDDIVTPDVMRSPTKMEVILNWWREMQSVKGISSPEKMVGTRYGRDDIYGMIIDEGHYPLVSQHSAVENGEPIYSYYTLEDLEEKRKKQGEYYFSCQYMNDPNPEASKIFPIDEDIVKYVSLPENPVYYIGVDMASRTGKRNDQMGIAIACQNAKQPMSLYFEEVYGIKMESEEKARHLAARIFQFKPKKVGIEFGGMIDFKVLLENALLDLELATGEKVNTEIVDVPTGKIPKDLKFNFSIAAWMRLKKAVFNKRLDALFWQFRHFNPNTGNNHDDLIDACCMVLYVMPEAKASDYNFAKHRETGLTNLQMFLKRNKKRPSWFSKFVA